MFVLTLVVVLSATDTILEQLGGIRGECLVLNIERMSQAVRVLNIEHMSQAVHWC